MAIQLSPSCKDIYLIVQAVIQLVNGRNNAGGTVTLRPNQTSTVVSNPNCSSVSSPQLTAMTAHAAAALATTYISSVSNGSMTITHASSPNTDMTFSYTVIGG